MQSMRSIIFKRGAGTTNRTGLAAAGALAALVGGADACAAPVSGVDTQYVDEAVRVQDDTYRHLNGKWLEHFEIPADKASYNSFEVVRDATEAQLQRLVEDASRAGPDAPAEARKVAALYASFMDEERLATLGLKPLGPELAAIDALKSKHELAGLIARLNRTDALAPYEIGVLPDFRDSTKYAVFIGQSGLGMPDRDYYLQDDAKMRQTRTLYLAHVERLLALAHDAQAHADAASILALETSMARIQWTKVENRDPVKTYNKTTLAALPALMPGYDWPAYAADAGFAGTVDYVIIAQPSYFAGLAKLIAGTPLPVWKAYFKWQVLSAAAPYLSAPFVDERFAFAGTVLRGVPENRPRWKRGLELLDGAIGEALGRLYVEKNFPPENKARMVALVRSLTDAYRADIGTLDWMGPETKTGAQAKLAKLAVKIGYPDRWRDYSALEIAPDDLWGNVRRANLFEFRRNIAKLGKPIDRGEWDMTPQTVNAYYNPLKNEIVFPAAILQPPFFNVAAEDAVNYGGIGAVIGHEISHGFDDQGSQFDADGNLHDWFTAEDHAKFAAKTRTLVEQYTRYEPVPGFHVNGELTLGENIADNSGLAIALKAYKIALQGRAAPVLDGLAAEQRIFYGWVGVWRGKTRENDAVRLIKTDPHSPSAVRGTAPLRNQDEFYGAFGVKEGDKMYLPPGERVSIW
jgi:predicted metalloendopeptidase